MKSKNKSIIHSQLIIMLQDAILAKTQIVILAVVMEMIKIKKNVVQWMQTVTVQFVLESVIG